MLLLTCVCLWRQLLEPELMLCGPRDLPCLLQQGQGLFKEMPWTLNPLDLPQEIHPRA